MRTPLILLKFIGKAMLNAAGAGIASDFLVEVLPQVARDVWDWWSKDRDDQQRRDDVQALAQAPADEIREAVAAVVQEVAADRPSQDREWLTAYLTLVPAVTRQSLRRPSDPTGTTVPPTRTLQRPDDLLPLLPTRLPRFKPRDQPLPGVDWKLVELLGVGGFGEVWKAKNLHFDAMPPVALKFCLDPAAPDRLLRHEAAILNQVMQQGKHPGIVPLQRTYLTADPPCLEYEFVSGGDLAGLIHEWQRQYPGPERAGLAARLLLDLARIVAFAHRLDPPIVHRDLKPANILVQPRPDGSLALRITDFGIGGIAAGRAIAHIRHNASQEQFLVTALRGAHTPLYASPQQVQGAPADPRDDVHALGVIWYQLLTGNLVGGRPGGTRWLARLAELGMTAPLIDLLASCVEEEAADRPADAAELTEKLAAVLAPAPVVPPVQPPRPQQPVIPPTEPPRPQESAGQASPGADVPAATPATVQKATGALDQWGEPLKMVPTGKWEAQWRRANAELLREWDLIYGLMTTPGGGIHHRPGPVFVSKESLRNRRVFVRKGSGKAGYVEIDKDKNEIDWEHGLVRRPVTPLKK